MTLAAVMAELEAAGSEQTRKTYKRHNVPEPMFGVSYAALDKIKKRIKRDANLASALWETGNSDARVLACKIADPAAIPPGWADQVDHKALAAALGELAAASPDPLKLAEQWIDASNVYQACTGWQVIANVAAKGKNPPEDRLAALLPRIEATIHQAHNAVKDHMNWALIAIGGCSDALAETTIPYARRIGTVEVDHGQTACETPDAEAYILKVRQRRSK